MSQRSILFIRADPSVAGKSSADNIELNIRGLADETFEFFRVGALLDGLRQLQEHAFDLILTDLMLPDGQGMMAVRHLHQHAPATPVIVLCNPSDRDKAVTAVREGAFDFFCYEDIDAQNVSKSVAAALKHAHSEAEKKAAAERRNNARFPCRLAVSYQTLEHPIFSGQGTSETLNISSKGLLFTSNERFNAGQLVQVSLDWPARLENQVPLKLVAEGRVVRNSNGQTAMTIDKYEFRTRRTIPVRPLEAAGPVNPRRA